MCGSQDADLWGSACSPLVPLGRNQMHLSRTMIQAMPSYRIALKELCDLNHHIVFAVNIFLFYNVIVANSPVSYKSWSSSPSLSARIQASGDKVMSPAFHDLLPPMLQELHLENLHFPTYLRCTLSGLQSKSYLFQDAPWRI